MTVAARMGALTLAGVLLSLSALRAEESHARAQLLRSGDAAPGAVVRLDVAFEIDPGWHIYWRNPGDAGTATEIEWTLPQGYSVDSIAWPLPHAIGEAPEVSYGYEERVTLQAFLRVPATAKVNEDVEIGARVKWLVCNEICIPGSQTLRLKLPVRQNAAPAASQGAPSGEPPRQLLSGETVEVTASDSLYALRFSAPWIGSALNLEFYPYEEAVVDHSAQQSVERTGPPSSNEATITVRRSTFAAGRAERMRGVIVATAPARNPSEPPLRFGVEIDAPVR